MTRGVRWAAGRIGPVVAVLALLLLVAAAGAAPAKRRAKKAPAKAVPESLQVLVKVGNEGITRADVQHRIDGLPEQFRANYSTPEGRQQILDRMVEEKVWMQMAVKSGVPERAQVKQQLDQQRRDLIIRTYVTEVMGNNPAPSDSELKAYYDEHAADYRVPATVTLRHIQTKSESDAKRAKQWAKGKQDWNALVKKFSTDSLTKSSGGSLGSITRDGVIPGLGSQPALVESVFALPEGAIGGPYKTDKGWHVVKIDAVKPESTRPFDQVRPMIARQLSGQRSQDYYKARLGEAREKLGVHADSAAIKGFTSARKSARDLFNEAQTLGPADARIQAYRHLLEEYPNSEVSAQAQFMIGFINSEELKNYTAAEQAFRELLKRYPKAELAASAQWMIDHMRSEDAPAFVELGGDSSGGAPDSVGARGRAPTRRKASAGKP